jgi:transketolase
MAVTNGARRLMADWLSGPVAQEYTLCADRDDRWRTGGSVDEVMEEAGLSADQILAGIERFVRERPDRLARIAAVAEAVASR